MLIIYHLYDIESYNIRTNTHTDTLIHVHNVTHEYTGLRFTCTHIAIFVAQIKDILINKKQSSYIIKPKLLNNSISRV